MLRLRGGHRTKSGPSPAQDGEHHGTGRRLYRQDFGEGLWIETYSWEAKVTLFISTTEGVLPAFGKLVPFVRTWQTPLTPPTTRLPSLRNCCRSIDAFFT